MQRKALKPRAKAKKRRQKLVPLLYHRVPTILNNRHNPPMEPLLKLHRVCRQSGTKHKVALLRERKRMLQTEETSAKNRSSKRLTTAPLPKL